MRTDYGLGEMEATGDDSQQSSKWWGESLPGEGEALGTASINNSVHKQVGERGTVIG